ncbi:MAG: zinc ribbon domain-containing protein [Firmicutes bacterium]|nr:zinc ribbon domain-containing protein [Bacillota bacterium]
MSRFDELKETIKKGVDKGVRVVKSTSRKMLAITHLHNELRRLQQAREEKLKTISERTCVLVREGKITLEELVELVEAVTRTEQEIAEMKEEIAQIRQADEDITEEQLAKIRKKRASVDGCDHEIPEGASFCPVCGRKV